jgi:FixJ family two-component response regulator
LRSAEAVRAGLIQSLPAAGIAPVAPLAQVTAFACRRDRIERTAGVLMSKDFLVSIVEDDRFFRESMIMLMESLGHRVEAFASAADFLASPRLGETACLIADVQMPVMTGIELFRHLIEKERAIPTILVTAYPDDEACARLLKEGIIGYLRKPVDDELLKRCLHAALYSRAPGKVN